MRGITQQAAMDWFKIHMPIVYSIIKNMWSNFKLTDTESTHSNDPLAYYDAVQANIVYPPVVIYHWLDPILENQLAIAFQLFQKLTLETFVREGKLTKEECEHSAMTPVTIKPVLQKILEESAFERLFYLLKKVNIDLRNDTVYFDILHVFFTEQVQVTKNLNALTNEEHQNIMSKRRECLRMLVQYGAQRYFEINGAAPLCQAVQQNLSYPWIEILLETNSNVDAHGNPIPSANETDKANMQRALIKALPLTKDGRHRPDIATLLLKKSAGLLIEERANRHSGEGESNRISTEGKDLLFWAAAGEGGPVEEYMTVIGYLLVSLSIDITDDLNNTPLMVAISKQQYQIANFLMNWGPKVNLANNAKQTALHLLAMQTCQLSGPALDLAEQLLLKGASVNAVDSTNHSALYFARVNKHTALVNLFEARNIKRAADTHKKPAARALSSSTPITRLLTTPKAFKRPKGSDNNSKISDDNNNEESFHPKTGIPGFKSPRY